MTEHTQEPQKELNKLPQHIKKGHQLLFSRQDLSAREQDVLALVMSSMKVEHWENKNPTYHFTCADISNYLGINNKHVASTLSPIADRLTKRNVGIKDMENDKFAYITLFKGISYDNGVLTVSPNDLLKSEYMEYRQGFALINTENFLSLKREYSKRLYEILCRFKGKGTLKTFKIDELKGLFGILDEQDRLKKDKNSFKNNSVFMKRCIRDSIEEIMTNAETKKELLFFPGKDQLVGYETEKKSNKIRSIKFLYRWVDTPNPENKLNVVAAIDIVKELELKKHTKKEKLSISELETLASAYKMLDKPDKVENVMAAIQKRNMANEDKGTEFADELAQIDKVLDKLDILAETSGVTEY